MPRIFISYKRNSTDDEVLVKELCDRFSAEHEVFVDKLIPPGADWAKDINEQLAVSDYVFVLISEASITSEMVRAEIDTVRRLFDGKKPKLVPIRVKYTDPYPYPLNGFLDKYQWVAWNGPDDTRRVFDALAGTLGGKDVLRPSSPPAPQASGPVVESGRVLRSAERIAIKRLKATDGVTLSIMGPSQMGKTQLVHIACRAARNAGKAVAVVDFKLFDGATLRDRFYESFCEVIAAQLSLDLPLPPTWPRFPVLTSCTKFVAKALEMLNVPVVLVLDDLERLVPYSMKGDFFGMLRAWHDSRDDGPFKKLSMALVATINLGDFTRGERFSPFNVAEKLILTDFTLPETQELARVCDIPAEAATVSHKLLGGHPWLTQIAFRAISDERLTLSAATTARDLFGEDSAFTDHLRRCLFSLQTLDSVTATEFGKGLAEKPCTEASFALLEGAGFLKGSAATPRPRCELYRAFLTPHFLCP